MSLFRVKLQNVGQGTLDLDPSTHPGSGYGQHGTAFSTSKQRSVFVMGPKHVNRLLSDGATFSDCNYWKRFAYPTMPHEQAFIEVLEDDGSVYSDVEEENTFAVVRNITSLTDAFTDANKIDFLTTYGAPAKYVQITNTDGSSRTLTVEINGDSDATFVLADTASQTFSSGDLAITQLRFKSNTNGGKVEVIASVRSAVNS